jgi:small neutral amino acid transporter SnatA (MarC family)
VTFGFLVAGFLATANAGRVALAAETSRPAPRTVAAAVAVGAALVVAAVLAAEELLDALAISPESFRIATGIVLGVAGVRSLVWPRPAAGPFAAVLVVPELALLAVSFGADEPAGRVVAAAVPAFLAAGVAPRLAHGGGGVLAATFLAALQVVVAIALVVSGIRDV